MSPMPAEASQAFLATTEPELPVPTGMDHERCDRCGFRAFVMTLHGDCGLPLTWCKHHFEFHRSKLVDDAGVMVVIDVRAQLVTS